MRVREKIKMDRLGLEKNGPVTIVAFGDSVTHGAFAPGEIDYDSVYHRRLARKLSAIRNYVPINVINAGIGGITAKGSLQRMESQVFSHSPDLVIVAFGLNDVNGPLEDYIASLKTVFSACIDRDIECIFLTPNMLNTYVAEDTAEQHIAYAAKTAEYQNGGRMDKYMDAARMLARDMGVRIADCYAKWKELSKTEDTTMLLINRINHPTREMHELFADTLLEIIMSDSDAVGVSDESTMYGE